MTKKPTKATEAEAAELDPAQAVQAEPEAQAEDAIEPVAEPMAPEGDGSDDGATEAEEVDDEPVSDAIEADAGTADPAGGAADQEGNQPEPQQAQDEQGGDRAGENQSTIDPDQQPEPEAEPTAEQLSGLARHISDKLAWHRGELIDGLTRAAGLRIERSIAGTQVEMAGISVSVPAMGPTGEYQALENWANAARRKVLELQAVQNA